MQCLVEPLERYHNNTILFKENRGPFKVMSLDEKGDIYLAVPGDSYPDHPWPQKEFVLSKQGLVLAFIQKLHL